MRCSQPKRRQQQEKIILGNPQFNMLTRRMCGPFLGRWNFGLTEYIGDVGPSKQPALVHKTAEIGCLRHIRRSGHDPVR